MQKLVVALNFSLYNRPLFRGHCVISQAIGTGILSVLSIDTTDVDTDGGRSGVGSGNDRYVCRTQGWYTISATVSYQGNGTGARFAVIYVNGVTVNGGFTSSFNTLSDNCGVTLTGLFHLNVNDYVQLVAYQDSGATFSTATTPGYQATSISIAFELAG